MFFDICICIYTSVLLCIYMHRESGYDSEVDPVVKLIWSKVCITIYGYLGSGIWDLGSGIWDLSSYT